MTDTAINAAPTAANIANSYLIPWVGLTLAPGLGPTRAKHLIEFLGGVEAVFNASLTELAAAGLPAAAAQSLGTGRSLELAQDEVPKANAAGVQLMVLHGAQYPVRLRQIYDPPLVLYVCGNAAAQGQHGIAVRRRCWRRD